MSREWSVADLSPLALAFIGDAVWELRARLHCLDRGVRKPGELHKACTRYVSSKAQARLAEALMPLLTPDEQAWVRRGRNAKSGHIRKNVDVLVYRHATGFETLIGYLSESGQQDRLDQIVRHAFACIDGTESERAEDAE